MHLKFRSRFEPKHCSVFYFLAASIPVVIASAGLCGVLEAYQRFDLANAVRLPMGLFNFLSPLFILLISHSAVSDPLSDRLHSHIKFAVCGLFSIDDPANIETTN
jgi:hypothetical protein